MSKSANQPPSFVRGITHPLNDKGNTTVADIAAGARFEGDWQQSNHPDILVSFFTPSAITINMQFSDDNGTNFVSEDINIGGSSDGTIVRQKGARYFRVCVANSASTTLSGIRIYTYHGDFNKSPDSRFELAGIGEGTKDDPFKQEVNDRSLRFIMLDVLTELKIANAHSAMITNEVILSRDLDKSDFDEI